MSETTTTDTTTEAAAETSGDSTEATATGATASETTAEDFKSKFEAQQKVNRDLERKFKEAATARDRVAELEAQVAKLAGKEAEYAELQAKRETETAALAKANDRILKSEVKAAAKGVLADPQDAYKFLDLDSFEVDDDGNVDEGAIASALADLVKSKPYLAAQGKRFQGSADGGARNDTAKVSQLSEADMSRMTPEQIAEAHDKGQFDDLLARR